MDRKKVSQEWLSNETGISRNTISELCGNIDYVPRGTTRTKIIAALRKVDPSVSAAAFW
jgi:hypothetical protein